MKKIIIAVLAVIAVVSVVSIFTKDLTSAEGSSKQVFTVSTVSEVVKDKLVDFKYIEDGKEKSFSDLAKGKVVFLNFWGTWCPPCRGEIPDIIKIQKELASKDIIIAGVALERNNTKDKFAKVDNFHTSNKMNYINFVDVDNKLNAAYGGMQYVPTTLIINKNGEIKEVIQGARSYEAFMESIKKVL
ncbi:MAG: TlpA disulfide reductase family protein [Candidatus Kapaibacterium sp.]